MGNLKEESRRLATIIAFFSFWPLYMAWDSTDFLVAQTVKNLPAMWETQVQSLGWEDPLEKGMATHLSILAWRIPWTEESGRLRSMELHRVGHDLLTNTFTLSLKQHM